MGLFRRHRDETLSEQLLREAGLAESQRAVTTETEPVQSEPPEPFPSGRPGATPFLAESYPERPAAWDAVTTADAPDLRGDRYEFATVPDGSVIVEETCDEDLSRLADAAERQLTPPYRALAVRQDERVWLVSARRISVVELPLDDGDELELSELGGRRIYSVDGTHLDPDTAPAELTQLGEREGTDYVVQAQRLDGNLWEVTASVL